MEAASGRSSPYAITDRLPGDTAMSVADPTGPMSAWDGAPGEDSKKSAATAGSGSSRVLRGIYESIQLVLIKRNKVQICTRPPSG